MASNIITFTKENDRHMWFVYGFTQLSLDLVRRYRVKEYWKVRFNLFGESMDSGRKLEGARHFLKLFGHHSPYRGGLHFNGTKFCNGPSLRRSTVAWHFHTKGSTIHKPHKGWVNIMDQPKFYVFRIIYHLHASQSFPFNNS